MHGVALVQARSVVVTAAASRIPAPPREAGVTTHILVPPRLPDATETLTPAAAPVPAAMVMAEAATTAPIRPEATAATTMADAMVAADFMRLRSADRMARPTQRAFIVVLGDSRAETDPADLSSSSFPPIGLPSDQAAFNRPAGTAGSADFFPGTSCQATMIPSLLDKAPRSKWRLKLAFVEKRQ